MDEATLGRVSDIRQTQESAAYKDLAFEVASIRSDAGTTFRINRIGPRQGGRFQAEADLRYLISYAYRMASYERIVGAEAMLAERFVITAAVSDDDVVATNDYPLLVRRLLADRFHLKVSFESEIQAVSVMRRVAADRLGPHLRSSDVDCSLPVDREGVQRGKLKPDASRCREVGIVNGLFTGILDMGEFARALSRIGRRAVVDDTGLSGQFEIEMTFNPVTFGMALELDQLPAFGEAMRNELGLKLESERRPVRLLMVEHAETPTPN